MNARALFAFLTAACFLWDCSGGGVRALPAANASDSGDLVASLVIKVPLHVSTRSHFVSPSTRSAEIAIKARPGCGACSAPLSADIGLTPTSKGCTDTVKGIACTVRIKLKPGTYSGSLTTYDGLPGCQSAVVPCHTLSFKQRFPLKISAGKVSVPAIVLAGVPHYVTYVDLDGATLVDRSVYGGQFGLVGPNAKGRLELYAADYDGNFILGPGAPSFTAGVGGGYAASVAGNVLLLTAPSIMVPGSEALTISAHSAGCKATGANCVLTATLQFDPLVAVAETTANAVAVYPSHIVQRLPFATIQSGISNPRALAFDGVGHLFVANANATVTEYAPPYGAGPIATFAGLKSPIALAIGANQDLAVADSVADTVYVFAPPSTTPIASIAISGAPSAIAFDSANELWVGSSGLLQRYPQPYTGTPNATLNGGNGIHEPVSIVAGPAGELDVADVGGGGAIDAFAAPYTGGPSHQVTYTNPAQVVSAGNNVAVCGQEDIPFLDPASLNSNHDIPVSDGGTQICATDQNADLYDIDAVYGDLAEFDATNYGFYGAMTEGISQPSALAAFPHP